MRKAFDRRVIPEAVLDLDPRQVVLPKEGAAPTAGLSFRRDRLASTVMRIRSAIKRAALEQARRTLGRVAGTTTARRGSTAP